MWSCIWDLANFSVSGYLLPIKCRGSIRSLVNASNQASGQLTDRNNTGCRDYGESDETLAIGQHVEGPLLLAAGSSLLHQGVCSVRCCHEQAGWEWKAGCGVAEY